MDEIRRNCGGCLRELEDCQCNAERVPPSQHRVVVATAHPKRPPARRSAPLSPRSRRVLTLPLKRQWFEAIKDGSKREEYRLRTDYWKKRLEGKEYDLIEFTLGYPKRDDMDRRMTFRYDGFYCREITSPEWDNVPQEVYAIRIGDAERGSLRPSGGDNGGVQLTTPEE